VIYFYYCVQHCDIISSCLFSITPHRSKTFLYSLDGPPASATRAEIVEFLRQLPTDDVVALCEVCFAVIDGRVLPSTPLDIYMSAKHNHVDLLIGCNSDEGGMVLVGIAQKFGINLEQLDVASARHLIGTFMSMYFSFPNAEKISEAVIEQYTSGVDHTTSNEDLYKILVEFFGDILFIKPMIETVNHHSRLYSMSFLFTGAKINCCTALCAPPPLALSLSLSVSSHV